MPYCNKPINYTKICFPFFLTDDSEITKAPFKKVLQVSSKMISKKVFLSYKNHDGNQVGEKVVLTENDFLVFISRAVLYPSEKKSIGPGLGDKIKEVIVESYGYMAEKGQGSSKEQKTQI